MIRTVSPFSTRVRISDALLRNSVNDKLFIEGRSPSISCTLLHSWCAICGSPALLRAVLLSEPFTSPERTLGLTSLSGLNNRIRGNASADFRRFGNSRNNEVWTKRRVNCGTEPAMSRSSTLLTIALSGNRTDQKRSGLGGLLPSEQPPLPCRYVVITSMIAGLPLRFASRPRFSASWSFSGSVTCSP
jgi:hypothetical protein